MVLDCVQFIFACGIVFWELCSFDEKCFPVVESERWL